MAERARFELAVQLPVRQFSKLVVSATHPILLMFKERARKSSKFIVLVETNNKKNEIFIEDSKSTLYLPQILKDTAKNCVGFQRGYLF